MYESDFTRFLRELKRQRPQLEEEQRKGRAIWWDKPQDLDTLESFRRAKVPQPAYVYQPRHKD